MSVFWRHQAGDTAHFAVELAFAHPPGGESWTSGAWGALTLWAGGKCLTAHVDRSGGEWTAVQWDLEPFLSWLAGSWDPLLHQQRLPGRQRRSNLAEDLAIAPTPPPYLAVEQEVEWFERWDAFTRTHFLLMARDGGPMPAVAFRRFGDEFEVSWTGEDHAGTELRYREAGGTTSVPVEEAARVLADTLDRATEFLTNQEGAPDRWADLRREVESILESGDARTARREELLVGDADLLRLFQSALQSAHERVPTFPAEVAHRASAPVLRCTAPTLMFGTWSPRLSDADLHEILHVWSASASDSPNPLVDRVPARLDWARQPWQQGYSLAAELRDEFGLGWGPVALLEPVLEALGVKLAEAELGDTSVPAIAMTSPGTAPVVLLNKSCRRMGRFGPRRIAIVHELCHLLHDRDRALRLAVIDGPWAPLVVEKRARAFAVYFLMPEEGIREWVEETGTHLETAEGLAEFAAEFGTSRQAAARHLLHLGWLPDLETADALVDELDQEM